MLHKTYSRESFLYHIRITIYIKIVELKRSLVVPIVPMYPLNLSHVETNNSSDFPKGDNLGKYTILSAGLIAGDLLNIK